MKSRFFAPILIVLLAVGVSYALAANTWTGPSGPPPTNNTPAPINVGATTQTKSGGDVCTTVSGVTKCIQQISSGGIAGAPTISVDTTILYNYSNFEMMSIHKGANATALTAATATYIEPTGVYVCVPVLDGDGNPRLDGDGNLICDPDLSYTPNTTGPVTRALSCSSRRCNTQWTYGPGNLISVTAVQDGVTYIW